MVDLLIFFSLIVVTRDRSRREVTGYGLISVWAGIVFLPFMSRNVPVQLVPRYLCVTWMPVSAFLYIYRSQCGV
jgi:hypothetical protein